MLRFVFQNYVMEPEQTKRPRRTAAQIKDLLALYELSGVTAKQFCQTHGINEGVFYKWRSRYAGNVTAGQSSFITLQRSAASDAAALFAEVKGIKLYQTVTASYLKELIA